MSNTHLIHIKYAIKYKQIWVYLAHDPGGLSTCQIRIKYAIKYTQIWVYLRWAEYTSNMHQIRKQIQLNMGVLGGGLSYMDCHLHPFRAVLLS